MCILIRCYYFLISGLQENKSKDKTPEKKDNLDPKKENYDEAAAVAAAIRESLKVVVLYLT
jgi:hypothetical protein